MLLLTQINLGANNIGGCDDVFHRNDGNIFYNPEGSRAIADALRVSASLTSIDLRGNWLGDEGAKCIAEGISICASLTSINLYDNGIGYEGAKHLAKGISVSALTYLDIRSNNLSGEGAVQLSAAVLGNAKIEKFNVIPVKELRADFLTEHKLEFKAIGIDGAMVLAGLMSVSASLTSIDLRANKLGTGGAKYIAEGIAVSASLTCINLKDNNIRCKGAEHIAKAISLSATLTQVLVFVSKRLLDNLTF